MVGGVVVRVIFYPEMGLPSGPISLPVILAET